MTAGTPSTIAEVLATAQERMEEAGVDSPWLTALVLLEHATGLGREAVLARSEGRPTEEQRARYFALVERRYSREPLAYILGYREFYGRRFEVTPDTLVPRPETEDLVHLALDQIDRLASPAEAHFLDVGTGCGAIAITLLDQRAGLRAVGTDTAVAALQVAARNTEAHEARGRLRLVACHLANAVRAQFPLVVANLPYIPTFEIDALEAEVARYEPRRALDGGTDGTEAITEFLADLPNVLATGGTAILEIGQDQGEVLQERARAHLPGAAIGVEQDTAGMDRFLVIRWSD